VQDLFCRKWGQGETGKVERERRRRIGCSLWAYAYEFKNVSLVSDAVFDSECQLVDSSITTGHLVLDQFFRTEFDAYTGVWIHRHPELEKVAALYERIVSTRGRHSKGVPKRSVLGVRGREFDAVHV
jgi:hypothetical protein